MEKNKKRGMYNLHFTLFLVGNLQDIYKTNLILILKRFSFGFYLQ